MNLKDLDLDVMQRKLQDLVTMNRLSFESDAKKLLAEWGEAVKAAQQLDAKAADVVQALLDARATVLIATLPTDDRVRVTDYESELYMLHNGCGAHIPLGKLPPGFRLSGARILVTIWPRTAK